MGHRGKRRPYLAVGWLWYLGTLVPVIGLVQVGAQALGDRYTYVPLIGVFIAVAWGAPEVTGGWRFRRLALGVSGGALVLALSVAAWNQTAYWRDYITLLSRAVTVTDRNWFAMYNLGVAYEKLGQLEQAIGYYRESLRVKPDSVEAWNNPGVAHDKLGQHQQAVGYLREALGIRPDSAKVWNNLGVSHGKLGQLQQAVGCFREALRIEPEYARAWNNLGMGQEFIPSLSASASRSDDGKMHLSLCNAHPTSEMSVAVKVHRDVAPDHTRPHPYRRQDQYLQHLR